MAALTPNLLCNNYAVNILGNGSADDDIIKTLYSWALCVVGREGRKIKL